MTTEKEMLEILDAGIRTTKGTFLDKDETDLCAFSNYYACLGAIEFAFRIGLIGKKGFHERYEATTSYYDQRKELVEVSAMMEYLQRRLKRFDRMAELLGVEDGEVLKTYDAMIACKEMAEVLIGEPVNLGKDGEVTIGL